MSVLKVDVYAVLEDIRSGLDDRELKEKHRLSTHALHSVYRDLIDQGLLKRVDRFTLAPFALTISAKEVVADLRSGLRIPEIMQKYDLSRRGLQGLLTILVDTGAISRQEVYGDLALEPNPVLPESFRHRHRLYLDFEIPIYKALRPEMQGRIRDITDDGIGILGLKAEVDGIDTYVVLGDAFGDVAPFELEARCRWCRKRDDTGDYVSGFQITYMSDKDRTQLTRLISLLTFSA